jgi:hypothetical protein
MLVDEVGVGVGYAIGEEGIWSKDESRVVERRRDRKRRGEDGSGGGRRWLWEVGRRGGGQDGESSGGCTILPSTLGCCQAVQGLDG